MIRVGKILKPHGLGGEVKVRAFTDDLVSFRKYKYFFVNFKKFLVHRIKFLNEKLIVKFHQLDDVDEVSRLKGEFLSLPRVELAAKQGDLVEDYLGLEIVKENGERVGYIRNSLEGNQQMFYEVVCHEDGKENDRKSFCFPCEKEMFANVDFKNQKAILKEGVTI